MGAKRPPSNQRLQLTALAFQWNIGFEHLRLAPQLKRDSLGGRTSHQTVEWPMRDGRRWLQPYPDARRLIRRVFVAFLLTFIAARMLVIGIMARRLPDLFLHLGGTHVHHLDYGIFLLAGVGALLLLAGLSPPERLVVAWLYGVGLALTFDEFGMWLHLGGGYWQRASFDAMTVLVGLLGIAAFAPPIAQWRPKHWGQAVVLVVVVAGFYSALALSFRWAAREEPRLEHLEQAGPG